VPSSGRKFGAFEELPDPGSADSLDDLVERLRLLKAWAGDLSYEQITGRVNAAIRAGRPTSELVGKTTVVSCFRSGRRRVNHDLVVAVVAALHPDVGYVAQWRQALQTISGQATAARQVRVQDSLPPGLVEFTGRTVELDQLRRALHAGVVTGGAVVVSAIAGMAGVGKTELAVHAGHLLAEEKMVDRALFVNLRGFHPDPAQPPADPAAVLDGFLRLLGVPGQQIPHDLPARITLYRRRLAGTRTLVLLDNAADATQVRPLLPDISGCPVLVTSRRDLTDLDLATHLAVDVFTPPEATAFLAKAAPEVPVGADPGAVARIAARCGHLPLALGLIAARIRAQPGWTLTDHADRLDERHHQQRLDSGVQLALDLSYQHLPADRQRLLRLVALHPGHDFDTHAAAALTGADPATTTVQLDDLCRDHLLQLAAPGRYTLHDLVRGYAAARSADEDPPPERRAALTRLFDFYLATAAAAMDTLYPAETHRRPRIPAFGSAPAPADPDTARAWLDTERPTLVTVAAHTATHGWAAHTAHLSNTLFRYLEGGYLTDAVTIHGHALRAARRTGDSTAQAQAANELGAAHMWLGHTGPAVEYLQQALDLSQRAGDVAVQAGALNGLGLVTRNSGRYRLAADFMTRALALYRRTDNRAGQAAVLVNLGVVEEWCGRYRAAIDYLEEALRLCQAMGDQHREACVLNCLGYVEVELSSYQQASDHLQRALTLFRQFGNRISEAATLDSLGHLHTRLGRPTLAAASYRQALSIFRETGKRDGEACAFNGLAEATLAAGHPADIGTRHEQARAHTGLGHAHRALGETGHARRHYRHAVSLYTELEMPDADQLRAHLAAIPTDSLPTSSPNPIGTVAISTGSTPGTAEPEQHRRGDTERQPGDAQRERGGRGRARQGTEGHLDAHGDAGTGEPADLTARVDDDENTRVPWA
jgi:tetratricopeptide (TPR) repeat protein